MPDIGQADRIIAQYEAMAAVTSKMLAAARAQDWDLLLMLETECAAHVATLKRDEPLVVLSKQQSQQKGELITRMLAEDGELRRLMAIRRTELSNELNSANTERKLSRAYGD